MHKKIAAEQHHLSAKQVVDADLCLQAIQEHDPQEKDPTSSTDSPANALDLRTTGTYSAKAAFTFFGKEYAEEAKRSVNNCKSRVANMFSDSEAFTDMLMDEVSTYKHFRFYT